jgi:hypothetical protein
MRARDRVVAGVGLLAAALVCVWLFMYVAPVPRSCPSFTCPGFDSGAVNVLGSDRFTLPEVLLIGSAIVTAASGLAWGILRWRIARSLGFVIFVMAVVVALWIPSRVIGRSPSVVCSTPGADGPILGRCPTGPPPTDPRTGERLLLVLGGAVVFGRATASDRFRRSRCHI